FVQSCSICIVLTSIHIYTLSLHDALPIYTAFDLVFQALLRHLPDDLFIQGLSTLFSFSNHVFLDLLTADIYKRRQMRQCKGLTSDRKSTRLNSSHVSISYAVFCL